MNRGAYDFVTKPINFEDLEVTMEKTVRQVMQMRETVKAVKENNILKMYVDETVLNFMGSREFESSVMVNENIEGTVVFIDICSFTKMSENEAPDSVIRVLNSYFDLMVKEIIAQGGYIDKFIGDAIMALFRDEYHLDRAIDACLTVRKRISLLPAFGDSQTNPEVSIGIHSGEMICGNIGSGELRRLDYTVIGDVVNTAQRLQDNAGQGQILISDKTYEKVKESFQCKKIGELKLKNKSQYIVAYEVIE
jgi:class 3 adenylate cyclase